MENKVFLYRKSIANHSKIVWKQRQETEQKYEKKLKSLQKTNILYTFGETYN